MNPNKVTKNWVWYGIEDLYFGFSVEGFEPHKPYSLFFEIMGLEKILKAYLLYQKKDRYTVLDDNDAKEEIDRLVKTWGHAIKKMLKEISNDHEPGFFENVKAQNFDGFSGQDFVKAVEAGYMESRYPTYRPIYEQFKINDIDMYRNPLESSGISKFIFHLCREILTCLKKEVALKDIYNHFKLVYSGQEPCQRFINTAFNGEMLKYF